MNKWNCIKTTYNPPSIHDYELLNVWTTLCKIETIITIEQGNNCTKNINSIIFYTTSMGVEFYCYHDKKKSSL